MNGPLSGDPAALRPPLIANGNAKKARGVGEGAIIHAGKSRTCVAAIS